jgi:hypothetical protein
LRFNQGFIWVQLGDRYTAGCKLGISNIHIQNQRREREGATCQHPIGPPQPCGPHHYTDLTCGSHQHATWQALTGLPQHSQATWQHGSNTPQHIKQYLLTHGSSLLVPLGSVDTWHLLVNATSTYINTNTSD